MNEFARHLMHLPRWPLWGLLPVVLGALLGASVDLLHVGGTGSTTSVAVTEALPSAARNAAAEDITRTAAE